MSETAEFLCVAFKKAAQMLDSVRGYAYTQYLGNHQLLKIPADLQVAQKIPVIFNFCKLRRCNI